MPKQQQQRQQRQPRPASPTAPVGHAGFARRLKAALLAQGGWQECPCCECLADHELGLAVRASPNRGSRAALLYVAGVGGAGGIDEPATVGSPHHDVERAAVDVAAQVHECRLAAREALGKEQEEAAREQ